MGDGREIPEGGYRSGRLPDPPPLGHGVPSRRFRLLAHLLGLVLVASLLALLVLLERVAPGLLPRALALGLALGLLGGGFVLAWLLAQALRRHFRRIERLRGALVVMAGDPRAVLPPRRSEAVGRELDGLYQALDALALRSAQVRQQPDRRLSTVVASISEALLVVTDRGQVSLVNHPARRLLGEERVRVGTSVYAALQRRPLLDAGAEAARRGRPVMARLLTVEGVELVGRVADLGEHNGLVLSFTVEEGEEHRPEIEQALELHDEPPEPGHNDAGTPLHDLAMLVLDIETTGLDVARAHVVSIGALRMHGARSYRRESFDRLVRPPLPIPPGSTAIHGITDAMVEEAEPFAQVYADLAPRLANAVLVGHNVAFDAAVLRRECARADRHWPEPPQLCTLLLCGALMPELEDLSLEGLAQHFGIDVHGRHTAFGDVLVTALILQRLLPLLAERGITTLGAAQALARRRKDILALQKESGWLDPP